MKRSPIIKMFVVLLSLMLLSFPPLLTFSQSTTATSISTSETIVYTTPQSISNHVYYLSLTMKGEVVINGTSERLENTSISGYISALGLPPLPLNGVPISPPQAIGDNIYFIYVPNVTSIRGFNNITEAYLAYANYTNGSWHLKNIITSGVVTGISVYNNSIYAIWKQSLNGKAYLLTISQNQLVRNISINVPNAYSIEVGNGVGVVSNVSSLSILNSQTSANVSVKYFAINLTNGKVIYMVPDYNNISPSQVSVSNDLLLVSYVQIPTTAITSPSMTSYIVLYNLSTGKPVEPAKSFNGIAYGYINGKFILVYNVQLYLTSVKYELTVYNLSWGQLYHEVEIGSPESSYVADGLYVNSTSVVILVTQLLSTVNLQTQQVTTTSSLRLKTAVQAPEPFAISVSEQHYPGYTILNISWNETQPSTYLVYVNGTLIGQTKSNSIQYNVTVNGTYLIEVVAMNPLGEVQENITTTVTVYPVQQTITTTTSTTTSSTITTTTTSSTTSTTTTSISATTSSAISSVTSSATTTSPTTTSSTTSFSTTLIVAIVVIIVIVIALIAFLARRR